MDGQPLPGRRRLLVGLAAPVALAFCPLVASDAAQVPRRRPLLARAAAGLLRPPPVRPGAGPGPRPGPGAALPPERTLSLHHLHTGESLRAAYHAEGRYLPDSLRAFAWLLRDWRQGRARDIDPALLDLLWALRRRLDGGAPPSPAPLQIVCGYRTPETNAMLRRHGEGVARNSLHIRGMAIDLRVPGRPLSQVRGAAASLRAGGVGYYPASDFVHVDTGRVRYW